MDVGSDRGRESLAAMHDWIECTPPRLSSRLQAQEREYQSLVSDLTRKERFEKERVRTHLPPPACRFPFARPPPSGTPAPPL